MGCCSAIKKNELMLFAATWMDLERVPYRVKQVREGKIAYDIPYMWNLIRNDTNELFKNRNRLIALENELMAAKKEGWGEGIIREFGMDMYTLVYLKWVTNNIVSYSSGNSAQCYVEAWMTGESGGECIHVYVRLNPFAVHLKLQYC